MPGDLLRTVLEQTVNGLVIGNVYALIAIGLALIFGVARLMNFSHGSVFMVGAYLGWFAVAQRGWPWPAAMAGVAAACALLGVIIERVVLRPLRSGGRTAGVAPLLATIGVSFTLDQAVQLVFSPDPQSFHSPLAAQRMVLAGASVGWLDVLIACTTLITAVCLLGMLHYTRAGLGIRAVSINADAAAITGADVDGAHRLTFAIASACAGVGGMLVALYFSSVYPGMSFSAMLKGFAANVLGGLGSVPGAIVGGLVLGLLESYGVALLGTGYRNLFAYGVLVVVLALRPGGLMGDPAQALDPDGPPSAAGRLVRVPRAAVVAAFVIAALLPLGLPNPYVLQVCALAWAFGVIAVSFTLVTGTAGQMSLGHAGFVALGAYGAALVSLRVGAQFELALLAGITVAALAGPLLSAPALRLRGPYAAIITLGVGEIVALSLVNWEWLTNGPLGLSRIPPVALLGWQIVSPAGLYWVGLAMLAIAVGVHSRLIGSRAGRAWRALRDDEVVAESCGVNIAPYKRAAFAVAGGMAGAGGAYLAHMYSYISPDTFGSAISLQALTMAILGGLGNPLGAAVGALLLTGLPELLRVVASYRYVIYGILLIGLVRFRPQGLLGSR